MAEQSCPGPARLGEHLDGTLPAEAEAAVVAHLDTCVECQRTLERLAGGDEPLLAVARQIGARPPAPTPALQAVLCGLTDGGAAAEPEAGPDGGVLALPGPPEQAGELGRLGPYAVLGVVGRGGMGVVLKARDESLRRPVAIKVLAPHLAAAPSARERFLREARAAAAVRNEHVVAIHDVLLADASAPGGFRAPALYNLGLAPTQERRALAVADLNLDGLPDLALAWASSEGDRVAVLLNDPRQPGAFLAPAVQGLGSAEQSIGAPPVALTAADVNRDGYPDLLVTEDGTRDLSLLRNNPASPGAFLTPAALPVGLYDALFAAGDFQGDGALGLALVGASGLPSGPPGVLSPPTPDTFKVFLYTEQWTVAVLNRPVPVDFTDRPANAGSVPNAANGSPVTLTSSAGTTLGAVRAVPSPSPADQPPGAAFPFGFLAFTVSGFPAGGAATVELTLPPGAAQPTTFYKYGPTPANRTPHWYQFLYRHPTDGDAASTTGAEIQGNHIILHFADGQRGDDDLAANGLIVDPGGPAVTVGPGRGGPQTVGAFDPSTATWYLRGGTGSGPPDAGQFAFGGAGWQPVLGDWDGDGTATVGAVDGTGASDPRSAVWYLRNENSAGPPDAGQFQYGVVGGVPVVGDWGGAGHLGVGVFDPQTFTWYLRNELSAGPPDAGVFQYGGVGWRPVVGDWAGSGHTGVGAFDPTTGTWYLRSEASAGAPDAGQFAYGGQGWLPVAVTFAAPQHLLAAGGEGPGGAAPLSADQFQAAVSAALARLTAAGADPALLSLLSSAQYDVAALPPGVLGLTDAAARQVFLSADAAGYGWFADTSAGSDAAFGPGAPGSPLVALPGSPAEGKEDLLSAVLHEMGHLAGRADPDGGRMAASLAAGTRDTLALDLVFSQGLR
jgi:hypothetical protein